MGMFERDRAYGVDLTAAFPLTPRGVKDNGEPIMQSDQFVLWGARVLPDRIQTRPDREAGRTDPKTWTRKVLLQVASMDAPAHQRTVTTLASAIADKAEKADDGFPVYVRLGTAAGNYGRDALVIELLGDVDDTLAAMGGGRRNHAMGVELPPDPDAAPAAAGKATATA